MVVKIIKMISADLVFVNSDNLLEVRNSDYLCSSYGTEMEQSNPNLNTDFVKDMQTESPAKELKEAVVADRIPNRPKNVHWVVKAIVEPFHDGHFAIAYG